MHQYAYTLIHQYAYQKILASTPKLFSFSFRKSTIRSRVKASVESDNEAIPGFPSLAKIFNQLLSFLENDTLF